MEVRVLQLHFSFSTLFWLFWVPWFSIQPTDFRYSLLILDFSFYVDSLWNFCKDCLKFDVLRGVFVFCFFFWCIIVFLKFDNCTLTFKSYVLFFVHDFEHSLLGMCLAILWIMFCEHFCADFCVPLVFPLHRGVGINLGIWNLEGISSLCFSVCLVFVFTSNIVHIFLK